MGVTVKLFINIHEVEGMVRKTVKKILRTFWNSPQVLVPSPERMKQFENRMEIYGDVLDMGTGSGVLSEMALRKGAKSVTSVDINPAAVRQASKRVPEAKVLLSDLFEKVEGRFDNIIFAAPWSEGEVSQPFDHAIFDTGVSERFFQKVKAYLKEGGSVWFEYSDAFPDNFKRIVGFIEENGFIVRAQWSFQDWGKLVKREVGVYLYRIEPL
jgi:methylase of polypeptide subunit release factors